jgi:hypothetical protein
MSISTEKIVNPAPSNTCILPSSSISCCLCEQVHGDSRSEVHNTNSHVEAIKREDKIKCLNRQLRLINNTCGPIDEYIKFQTCLNPRLRMLSDINQWMLLMYTMKAVIKTDIDHEYMDITNPPDQLKMSMATAYDNLNLVSESFATSMKEILLLIQSEIEQQTVSSTPQCNDNSIKLDNSAEPGEKSNCDNITGSILSIMTGNLDTRLPRI